MLACRAGQWLEREERVVHALAMQGIIIMAIILSSLSRFCSIKQCNNVPRQ